MKKNRKDGICKILLMDSHRLERVKDKGGGINKHKLDRVDLLVTSLIMANQYLC